MLVKQGREEMDNVVRAMTSAHTLGPISLRQSLREAAELAFRFIGSEYQIKVEARTVDFEGTNHVKRNYGEWASLVLVDGGKCEKRNDFPHLIAREDRAFGKPVFFIAPRNTDLFDYSVVYGETIDLFQVAVSDSHAIPSSGKSNCCNQ
jgi:hypothetical protein